MSMGRLDYFCGRGPNASKPWFPAEVWDPFYPFPAIQADAFAEATFDWRQTPEAHQLIARLPGVKKEEVRVEVECGGVLKISGERRVDKEDKGEGWNRVERSSEHFLRRFAMPENASVEGVMAAMETDGVLTVTVPKRQAAPKKPEVKLVQIA